MKDLHDPTLSSDACRCPCHKAGGVVVHTAPCCLPCPRCGQMIVSARLGKHLVECRGVFGLSR